MIKLENAEVLGWEHAIRGCRNPMNSWDKSDSYIELEEYKDVNCKDDWHEEIILGDNDLSLMKRLCKAGTDHRKFMRMITVYVDVTAPLYWWKEFDTYKVGTVANSCSTMHKIADKEFTINDFSHEHLDSLLVTDGEKMCPNFNFDLFMESIVFYLNTARQMYIKTKDKKYWWQMIQLLPSSYNQKRTVMLNYEVLANIYKSRKEHKLDEWQEFCEWIETLPYSELIVGEEK